MAQLRTWGDLLAAGQGLAQSAPVTVTVGGAIVNAVATGDGMNILIAAEMPPVVEAEAPAPVEDAPEPAAKPSRKR